jgi:hypothetical protein
VKLPVLEVPRQKAREAFLDYREAVRDRRYPSHEAEDEAMLRAYRALSKGDRVVVLSQAIVSGGTELIVVDGVWDRDLSRNRRVEVEVPKLAAARADKPRVWTSGINPDGDVAFVTKLERHQRNRQDVIERAGIFPPGDRRTTQYGAWRWSSHEAGRQAIRAMVPSIPPKLRPKRSQLSNFHILFEAEWTVDPTPLPPVDPALLRHLGGDLYAVVAVWDLTDVERAVLAITR